MASRKTSKTWRDAWPVIRMFLFVVVWMLVCVLVSEMLRRLGVPNESQLAVTGTALYTGIFLAMHMTLSPRSKWIRSWRTVFATVRNQKLIWFGRFLIVLFVYFLFVFPFWFVDNSSNAKGLVTAYGVCFVILLACDATLRIAAAGEVKSSE